MKRIFFSITTLIAAGILFQGCFKDDSEELKAKEKRLLEQYLLTNNITQQPTASGLYFILIKDTAGYKPAINDLVEFEYTGELIDGQVFGTTYESVAKDEDIYNENTVYGPIRILLANALAGLAEGFQLMEEGEKAMMILPSDIAYGGRSIAGISRYSTLIFTIDLQKVISDPVNYEKYLILDFLLENGYTVQPTTSGLYYIEHVAGEGNLIADGNRVDLRYKGYFLDGRTFDSNIDDELPYTVWLPDDQIIEGWSEGLKLMRKSSEGTLIIPYDLAYGPSGLGNISPYMTLVFDITISNVY